MKPVRCAIYTRKSSDEGLEQSFSSLDAQREACGAYILSQASEGWSALPDIYDDGGLSGGTLQRPALQRLLAEVAAGRVDTIVVYKVDRLTRSLFDFAKLVERFDAAKVTFVSVTQSFNTTTSMGRLTLNMLLSFAQFEREVTTERIRDKIAASKARGMWMGGTPPLGYAPDGRSLAIIEEHAALVRHLFARFLGLGSVRRLEEELKRHGVTVPARTLISGRSIGAGAFTRGQLYQILRNVTYIGKIAHKGKVHAGLHEAIVDDATFAAAQATFASHVPKTRSLAACADTSLFGDRVVDADGEPLIATYACKTVRASGVKVRHRYYVTRALHYAEQDTGLRIPARELELLVGDRLRQLLSDPLEAATAAGLALTPEQFPVLHVRCEEVCGQIRHHRSAVIRGLITQVRISEDKVIVTCDAEALAAALSIERLPDAPTELKLACTARLTRSGRALRLVHDGGALVQTKPDKSLIRLLVQARQWWTVLRAGKLSNVELAAREGVTPAYVTRVVRLAFLAPAVTDAILGGRQRAGVTAASLTRVGAIQPDWQDQVVSLLPTREDG